MTEAEPRAFNIPASVVWMLALLVAIHVLRGLLGDETDTQLLVTFAFIPARAAGLAGSGWPEGMGHDAWTWLSYAFLHADATHLTVNAIWLVAFASPVARRFGMARFYLLAVASALAGALAHLLTHWGQVALLVGASAMVSAYMGAAIRFVFDGPGGLAGLGAGSGRAAQAPARPVLAALQNRTTVTFLLVWIAINFLFGLGALVVPGASGGIAWQAHLGGFAVGFFGFALFDPPQRPGSPPKGRAPWQDPEGGARSGNGHDGGHGRLH
ncbi:MAG: rhomboid family intramembrane serine protease [Rhodobiaceae bacterium]|nr:rhomboid family intramembrane serine protease [Rhodobiaceae bacterium]